MESATVRELKHHFSKIEGWVQRGECVSVSKRGEVIFEILPRPQHKQIKPKKFDFERWLNRVWGDRCLNEKELKMMRDLTDRDIV